MYKKVLVPLDGSKRAERILPHVEKIASWAKSEVIFLQVVDVGSGAPAPNVYMAGIAQDAELYWKLLQDAHSEAVDYLKGKVGEFSSKKIKAKSMAVRGNIVNAIIAVAEDENVDLIAMASHGRTGLSRVFYGSVVSGVLHKVNRPILVIRAEND